MQKIDNEKSGNVNKIRKNNINKKTFRNVLI